MLDGEHWALKSTQLKKAEVEEHCFRTQVIRQHVYNYECASKMIQKIYFALVHGQHFSNIR